MQKSTTQRAKSAGPATRRQFLALAGAATGGAALAAAAQDVHAEAKPARTRALYRESDHVKRYYELAR